MNVLHLITSLSRGGAENHLTCLIRGQLTENKKIYVIYLKGDGYWVNYLLSLNVVVIKLSFFNFFSQLKKVKEIIKKFKIDIIHSHLPHMEIIGYFALFNNTKTKFVITKHVDNDYLGGSNIKKKSLISSLISYFIYKRANNIIAISHSVKKFLIDSSFHNIKSKIRVVYYGLDNFYIQKCLTNNQKIFLKKNNELIFGFIGRLVKQKQIDKLILSFREYINETNINAKLVIAGSGPEKKNLLNYIKELQIENKIIWLKFTDNVGAIFKEIDVFCINSLFEGLGLVMLEAMVYKKPIIGPNNSAISEVISNNKNGLLVKPNNIEDYKNAMIKMSNSNTRLRLSNNSLDYLKKNFDYQTMLNKINQAYNS